MIKIIDDILFLIGSIIIIIWGILHISPIRSVLNIVGDISLENKKIIVMGWVSEGLILCFLGFLVFLVTAIAGTEQEWVKAVYWAITIMLFALAMLTLLTGFRTRIILLKFNPFVKIVVAIIFLVGILL